MPGSVLQLRNLGPIKEANLEFANLTVLTGPQASGKSIALEMLKLVIDLPSVRQTMVDQGLLWPSRTRQFLDLFFGDGMRSIWSKSTSVRWQNKSQTLGTLALRTEPGDSSDATRRAFSANPERVFYIPAQRVMSLRDGFTRPFGEYRAGDPYVLREFSQHVHQIVQGELTRGTNTLFPKGQRFNSGLRHMVSESVFGGWELAVDTSGLQKEFVLTPPQPAALDGQDAPGSLKFLAWSAGQREFVPLLLGLYKLLPAGKVQRRESLDWAIIEEPESGLHPRAIAGTMAFVFELLRRGYKVALSTHSPQVLDVVWGLRTIREHGGDEVDAARLVAHKPQAQIITAAKAALDAVKNVYYFDRDRPVVDISALDPNAANEAESGWGGLTAFSENVASVVTEVVQRAQATQKST